jgi:hypothetical protein
MSPRYATWDDPGDAFERAEVIHFVLPAGAAKSLPAMISFYLMLDSNLQNAMRIFTWSIFL